MGETFEVKATGFREMLGAIMALEEQVKGSGLNDLATQVGAALLNRMRTRFLAETDPDGQKWVPSTFGERRKAQGKGGGTLFDTGALFHSIQLGQASGGEVNIGTDIPYARKHQEGEDGEVQRVFLGFGGDDVKFTEDIIQARLEEIIRRGRKN